MDYLRYQDSSLYCEDLPMDEIADRFGTPCYVYSQATLEEHVAKFTSAFEVMRPLVCFAVKSCSNIHLLRILGKLGIGADVVSGGELFRALSAGIPSERIVYAGVGKTAQELQDAVDAGVRSLNIESEGELELLEMVTRSMDRAVRVAVRVNPDVAGHNTPDKTTTGIRGSKFGVDLDRIPALFDRAEGTKLIQLDGLHVHLGSPIYAPAPYVQALEKLLQLVELLLSAGHVVRSINLGGGFAAAYETGAAPEWLDYAASITPLMERFVANGGQVILEPGRSIVANAGALLTRLLYVKEAGGRHVAVVDTGMNHLMRAVLYDAFHFMWPTQPVDNCVPMRRTNNIIMPNLRRFDVVGPVCESTDYLARDRNLPRLSPGELLCIFGTGAYGITMASQYNSIPRPPEVLINRNSARLIRRRETYQDLISTETELY